MGSKSEPPTLPSNANAPQRPKRARLSLVLAAVLLTAFIRFSFVLAPLINHSFRRSCGFASVSTANVCPQPAPLSPSTNAAVWSNLTALHRTPAFHARAVAQLSAAVQIPTETFDSMGPVGEDPRWASRGPFVDHLTSAFPRVHANLALQKVNTYGLIYTWQGSDATLKPLLLMGHYDVVPVAPLSADEWTFPAYSGHFDGENIWGRGSSDDKSGVIGILTSVESLLEAGFAPTRTVILSFGFDEEAGGYHVRSSPFPILRLYFLSFCVSRFALASLFALFPFFSARFLRSSGDATHDTRCQGDLRCLPAPLSSSTRRRHGMGSLARDPFRRWSSTSRTTYSTGGKDLVFCPAVTTLARIRFPPSCPCWIPDGDGDASQLSLFLPPLIMTLDADRFGPDSFAMIVDEGAGFTSTFGAIVASPGIAEKGGVNLVVEVQTPGEGLWRGGEAGHGAVPVPPAHTSIGILAALIVHMEANAPVPKLETDTPAFNMAACFAVHAPDVPHKLKRAILRAPKSEKARKRAEDMLLTDPMIRALVGTTQAVDIVSGGVKSNALPEQAMALVNHRIATQSSVNATLTRDANLLLPLAERFNLSVTAFGEALTPSAAAYGTLELSAPQPLEPAPITPSGSGAKPYELLAGTIREVFRVARTGVEDIVVAPGLMTGNTDTRYNWELSKHIFRYGHGNMITGGLGGIHTVNEHIKADAFVEMITFFTTLILNADEAEL
ncbi:Carboxypeptidase S [Mycena sanguinolenta]|uniref:Carboxypeptidase S n=1 Tax=Mycena sanguinolenta TaxID=230812 RepID=A0A8H6XCK0_9AGAR|nr:Carboxypeptidase S [Mycena sanguinolenta]